MVKIFINEVDAFSRYGIFLTSGGFSALRKPAPVKQFIEGKSRLQDGKRVILKNPKVDERQVNLPIVLVAKNETDFISKYDLFCKDVLEKGKIEIKVSSQPSVIYRCVYEDCQQYTEFISEMAKFVLKLTELNPKDRGVVPLGE